MKSIEEGGYTDDGKLNDSYSAVIGGGGMKTGGNADDSLSAASFSSTSSSYEDFAEDSSSRDEVKQIRDMSKKDTFRVQTWRMAVTVLLLLTAVAVTATTYYLLDQEEYKNFEIAVSCLLLRSARNKRNYKVLPRCTS